LGPDDVPPPEPDDVLLPPEAAAGSMWVALDDGAASLRGLRVMAVGRFAGVPALEPEGEAVEPLEALGCIEDGSFTRAGLSGVR
jgi:hypothetical protein